MDELLQEWRDKSMVEKDANGIFLKSLSFINDEIFQPKLIEAHQEAFRKIDCLGCANCCKTSPALLTNADIKRIAKHLSVSPKQFSGKYVIEDINGEKSLNRIPCAFLNPDNSCSIYEFRPEACRRYPHTDEKDYKRRAKLNLENTIVCPAAYHILQNLKVEFPNHDL